MALDESKLKLKRSDAHAGDDTSPTGGAISATEITTAAPGDWIPYLQAKQTGTVDNAPDVVHQTQVAYMENTDDADNWIDAGLYMANALIFQAASGVAKVQSTSTTDDNTKKARVYGVSGGVLAYEDLLMNGTTEVVGLIVFSKIFRVSILDASNNSPLTADGVISVKAGTSSELLGAVTPTYGHASAEYEFAAAATLGDMAALTNRTVKPSGLTWVRANSTTNKCWVRGTAGSSAALAPGGRNAVYCYQELQPGMPNAFVGRDIRLHGGVG